MKFFNRRILIKLIHQYYLPLESKRLDPLWKGYIITHNEHQCEAKNKQNWEVGRNWSEVSTLLSSLKISALLLPACCYAATQHPTKWSSSLWKNHSVKAQPCLFYIYFFSSTAKSLNLHLLIESVSNLSSNSFSSFPLKALSYPSRGLHHKLDVAVRRMQCSLCWPHSHTPSLPHSHTNLSFTAV